MALTESTMLELGTIAPDFALTDVVTGKTVRRDDFRGQKALLVMFICAHCPYVKHIEKSLGKLGADYAGKPLGIVAISANDAVEHPADSPAGLKQQAKDNGLSFRISTTNRRPWLMRIRPPARQTSYLFDAGLRLVYRGQYDASRPNNGIPVTGKDLRAAIDTVLAGKPVPADQRPSIGCNIKWKEA